MYGRLPITRARDGVDGLTSHHGKSTDHSNIIAGVLRRWRGEGAVFGRSTLRAGLETLLTGAAAIAFVVGALLRQAFGAA
jgi:hypothetical protein